jgi:threonine aldolase
MTNRRTFLRAGALGAAGTLPLGWDAIAGQALGSRRSGPALADATVKLTGDGLALSPAEYAQLVMRLVEEKNLVPDSYSIGGVVEELEHVFARALNKERAVFMPTGTLANHLAIRALAGGSGRVAVQELSHIYQDSGDCVQTLSGLPMMPLAPGAATFKADDLQRLIDVTKTGRVATRVSVVSVETPVRRASGEMFDAVELERVVAVAKMHGARLHLDGARVFLESAYSGRAVDSYAQPFDTVYVSLYKYFNAPSGAMLAGPKALLDDLFHTRRMFGGGLAEAWPFALVALHYFDGFRERYGAAVRASKEFLALIGRDTALRVLPYNNGTNLFRLEVRTTNPKQFQARLAADGIVLGTPNAAGRFLVAINETFTRRPVSDLAASFSRAAR